MQCHGCEGMGWVDSQYKGAQVCPICGGTGQLAGAEALSAAEGTRAVRTRNKNPLLWRLEDMLTGVSGVEFHHSNKTMNSYFRSGAVNWPKGLLWVPINGTRRVFLAKVDYSVADPQHRVGQGGWGGYPFFSVESEADLSYLLDLVRHAVDQCKVGR